VGGLLGMRGRHLANVRRAVLAEVSEPPPLPVRPFENALIAESALENRQAPDEQVLRGRWLIRAVGRRGVRVSGADVGAQVGGDLHGLDVEAELAGGGMAKSFASAAHVKLDAEILDRIDELVAPGVTLNADDNSYRAAELTPQARRR
jgi:hypothetical protein